MRNLRHACACLWLGVCALATTLTAQPTCDNVTDGGTIQGAETGCPQPTFDPSIIFSVDPATGGSGAVQYLWMFTTDDPTVGGAVWQPIFGSNAPDYDPGPITQTTHYVRCARRAGCTDYVAETDWVTKTVECCDNIIDGGSIGFDQDAGGCGPFDPNELVNVTTPTGGDASAPIEYLWFSSTVGGPFSPDSPNWTEIPNSNAPNYDPGPLDQTTYFIRCARRAGCSAYTGETNQVVVTVDNCCDNVTDGGSIGFDQTGCAPFDPDELTNVTIPTGGSGALEFLWFSSTVGGPFSPDSPNWTEIPNSNAPNYDPGPLDQTTYFIRCSRRAGCTLYTGETNQVVVTVDNCCDNVTDGGSIGFDQDGGCAPFDPDELTHVSLPTGGSGALEYLWFSSTVGGPFSPDSPNWTEIPNSNAPNYDPGPLDQTTYFIRCSRRAGCTMYTGETNQVVVTVLPSPDVVFTFDDIACFGESVQVTLDVIGVDTPYLVDMAVLPDTGFVVELTAGSYPVMVTGANGCVTFDTLLLTQPNALDLELTGTNTTCFNGADGTVSAQVTGGTAPYSYLWNNGALPDQPILENLGIGAYTVVVTDANGCTRTDSLVLEDVLPLDVAIDVLYAGCAGATQNTLTATPAGGTPPYTYVWDDPSATTDATLVDPPFGTYSVTVTDSNGCTGTATATLSDIEILGISLSATDASCATNSTGSVAVEILTGTPPFDYLWTTGDTTATVSSLQPGDYSVTVTDANGCAQTGTTTVGGMNILMLELTATDATCFGGADGSVTSDLMTTGTPPIDYLWNTGATTPDLTGLPPGTYTLTVTDAAGCSVVDSVAVGQGMDLDFTLDPVSPDCFGEATGSITLDNLSGGTPPYAIAWSTGADGPTLLNLPAGDYTFTVTDATGCSFINVVQLLQPAALELQMQALDASCNDLNDGGLAVLINGGTAPYDVLWETGATTAVLMGLAPGDYGVTVTDANGCSTPAVGTVETATDIEVDLSATDVDCAGASTGSITSSLSGGQGNFTYAWSNGATTPDLIDVPAGTYTLTVTDSGGCFRTASAEVAAPAPLVASPTLTDNLCADDANGAISVAVAGGTPPYTYAWSNGATTAGLTDLPNGTYGLVVTDANGCTLNQSYIIDASNDLDGSVELPSLNCANSTGTLTAMGSGGTPPYAYVWSNGATTDALLVGAGSYSVSITDADGCSVVVAADVTAPDALVCSVVVDQPVTSYNGTDGGLSASVQNGSAPFTYAWSNGGTTATLNGLSAGTYTVTITDANGCTCTAERTLTNPSKIGDFVFRDLDGDGVQDANEAGVANVTVTLTVNAGNGTQTLTTLTDLSGGYMFDGLAPGVYKLTFSLPNTFAYSPQDAGADEALDSDVDPTTGMTETFGLVADTYDDTRDAGLTPLDELLDVGDMVFHDLNRDGIMQAQETGVGGVTVRLYNALDNQVLLTDVTDGLGKYLFEDVAPGEYFIEFAANTLPNGWIFTSANQGSDDTLDSDADPTTGRTEVFSVFPFSADDLRWDAGVFEECDDVTNAGAIAGDETLCGPLADPALIVSLTPASGGSGAVEYLWLRSDHPIFGGVNDPNWQPVPNSNVEELDPQPIATTTYYVRCARRMGCPAYVAETNVVEKKVQDAPLAFIEFGPDQVCAGEAVNYQAGIAGGGASYAWNFPNGTPATASTRKADGIVWNTPGTYLVELSVTRLGCTATTTREVTVTDCNGIFNLTAQPTDEQTILLHWETQFDDADYQFYVESSTTGTDFRSVDRMDARTDQHYTCTDDQPTPGRNYYRIKAFHRLEGTHFYSAVVHADHFPATTARAVLHPNVTATGTMLTLARPHDHPLTVLISDAYGTYSERVLPAGTQRLELTTADLVPGVYVVHLRGRGLREFGLRLLVVR